MRDLLLLLIVVPGGLLALRHPFVGAMMWTWISIMNPHRLAWSFMYDAPVALFIAVCTLVGLLSSQEKRSPFISPPVTWLVLLETSSVCGSVSEEAPWRLMMPVPVPSWPSVRPPRR